MSARRSAIGSASANTALMPQANAIATATKRFMSLSPIKNSALNTGAAAFILTRQQ
jgi:hypothetical protein